MTADRGQLQSVEKARQYQTLIPNLRLVVLRSDAYLRVASLLKSQQLSKVDRRS